MTVTETLAPLLGQKCATCEGFKQVCVNGHERCYPSGSDGAPCPDCQVNGKPSGLRYWKLVRECKFEGDKRHHYGVCTEHNISHCFDCHGLVYVLLPEAELVGAMLDWCSADEHSWSLSYDPNDMRVPGKHFKAVVWPNHAGRGSSPSEALADALVKATVE